MSLSKKLVLAALGHGALAICLITIPGAYRLIRPLVLLLLAALAYVMLRFLFQKDQTPTSGK